MAQAKKSTAAKSGDFSGKAASNHTTNTTKKTGAKKVSGGTGGKKKSGQVSTGKKTERASREADIPADGGIRKEILILLALAVSVLLFLGVLDKAGSIGTWLHKLQFGLFGSLAWIFPIMLFMSICFMVSNSGAYRNAAVFKIIMVILSVVALCGILEMLGGRGMSGNFEWLDYYKNASQGINGGLIGGILFSMMYPALGAMGTYVVLVAVLIIGFVFITGKSFIKPIQKGGKKVVDTAKEDYTRIRERQAIRSAEKKERRRIDQKVQGIALEDTDLAEDVVVSDEAELSGQEEELLKRENMSDTETAVSGQEEISVKIHRTMESEELNISEELQNGGISDAISEPFMVRKERRTLTELDALDARLKQELDAMDDYHIPEQNNNEKTLIAEPLVSRYIPGEEHEVIEIASAEEHDEPAAEQAIEDMKYEPIEDLPWEDSDDRTFEPDSLEVEWDEDPMAAYDDFGGPSPEEVVREVNMPLNAGKKQGTASTDSIWKQGDNKDGSSGVTFRGSSSGSPVTVKPVPVVKKEYIMPSTRLLKLGPKKSASRDDELKNTAAKLQQTLRNFGVGVTVTDISCGPSVTRYELHPEQGVKVSRIVSLADDIKLNLAAADIRIEAPIPGKAAVGIEVPNAENEIVYLRELLESDEFRKFPSKLGFAVGRDIAGKVIVADLARMPHLLIAGATGSGKSVCINTLIMSILYKAKPDEVKLILIDPKVVELSVYNGIPHLLIPVVTDPKKAAGALNWAVAEMTDRYKKFAEMSVRDIKGYNNKVENSEDEELEKMPQIVVIVDELADLMMVASGEVEEAICRLAQLARAAGIHLVLATQRPSVNVITGLIKANVPSRIAFAVSSGVDSRTIIDMVGAEKLLGKGDMLFYPTGYPKPVRVQGAFVEDEEVGSVTEFLTGQTDGNTRVNTSLEKHMANAGKDEGSVGSGDRDEYFERCGRFIIEKEKASIGNLQRAFKIGFNRAARIMDQLAELGVVGPEEGTKPRQILMTMEEFEALLETL